MAPKAARAESAYQQALGFHQGGRLAEARVLCTTALKSQPRHFNALHLLGLIDLQFNNPQRALEAFDQAISIHAASATAHHNQGNAHYLLMRYEAAVASYDRALARDPNCIDSYYNRGNALLELKQFEAAVVSFTAALAINPNHADASFNRGNGLIALGRAAEAIASFERAIAIRPAFFEAHNNLGSALIGLREFETAITRFNAAIAINPARADAHNNRGVALRELRQYARAVDSFERALALDDGYADAYVSRAEALSALGQHAAAIASFDRGIALKPDHVGLLGQRLHAGMTLCDWADFEAQVAQLLARIERNQAASSPLPLFGVSDSPRLQRRAAELWTLDQHRVKSPLPAIPRRGIHDKIRIGYFSADFRAHPVSILAAELFESHDRARFEVTAFAFGPPSDGPMRTRLKAAFERFVEVQERSDREVALLARELHIDIAVDLGGFTQHGRSGIFALRAAPVQVSFLGYAGTMGADFIDYLIADPTVIPEHSRQHYREQILYLPDSFMPHDSRQPIADTAPTRREAGLPEHGVVFCGFNNVAKITPHTFSRWMRILTAVPDSILWLSATNPTAQQNLRREALLRGVDAQRLIFAPRLDSLPEHLARHRLADLFLDTLPYNAHTTASDALWAGLPVLTLIGQTFAGRVAASLLNAIHLPELITHTEHQYEALAIELANDPAQLARLKQRLDQNRLTTPLFDTRQHTQHLENAYAAIHARHQAGLPAVHNGGVGPSSRDWVS